MDILLRQVRIIDPSSPFHQQTTDLFIQDGTITEIGSLQKQADREISLEGLHVSTGWVDVFAHFCDPGFEFRETIESGTRAAAAGGFTDVMVLPNTAPVLHNKAGVEYIIQRSSRQPVRIHPIGAVTRNAEGKELAEMYDMEQSGAVAFSDGIHPIQASGLLLKALQYVRAIDRTIIQIPDDRSLSGPGLMNEGIVSTQLGLPGKPAISEELMVRRDLELVQYTGSRLHITGISSAVSCELLRDAKSKGMQVTASTTPAHLYFSDEDLVQYDTNLKLNPPLRTKSDRKALHEAINDGTIDCIASHHLPQDIDHKIVEFEHAHDGMTALETSFAAVRTSMPELPVEKLVELYTSRPRRIFRLDQPSIQKGSKAVLTLFLPDAAWTVGASASRSKNSAFTGKQLTGKPVGIINQDQLFLNQ